MGIADEEDMRRKRVLRIQRGQVAVQALIGGGYEVCWVKSFRCPICGVSVVQQQDTGLYLSPRTAEADEHGNAYATPHRHKKAKKKA